MSAGKNPDLFLTFPDLSRPFRIAVTCRQSALCPRGFNTAENLLRHDHGNKQEIYSPNLIQVFLPAGMCEEAGPHLGGGGRSNIYNSKWCNNGLPAFPSTFSLMAFQGKLFAFSRCSAGFITLRKKDNKIQA